MTQDKVEIPFNLKEKLEGLKASLLGGDAKFATYLEEIRKITLTNPEFVYALSDEEIQSILAGMGKYQGIQIQLTERKPKDKAGAKNLTIDSI